MISYTPNEVPGSRGIDGKSLLGKYWGEKPPPIWRDGILDFAAKMSAVRSGTRCGRVNRPARPEPRRR
jgi:hypothetical protein